MSAFGAVSGTLMMGWGVFLVWKRERFGERSARSARSIAQVLPWLYGGRNSWTTRAAYHIRLVTIIGVWFIVLGVWVALTQP